MDHVLAQLRQGVAQREAARRLCHLDGHLSQMHQCTMLCHY